MFNDGNWYHLLSTIYACKLIESINIVQLFGLRRYCDKHEISERDSGWSWVVCGVAFTTQTLTNGFWFCYRDILCGILTRVQWKQRNDSLDFCSECGCFHGHRYLVNWIENYVRRKNAFKKHNILLHKIKFSRKRTLLKDSDCWKENIIWNNFHLLIFQAQLPVSSFTNVATKWQCLSVGLLQLLVYSCARLLMTSTRCLYIIRTSDRYKYIMA